MAERSTPSVPAATAEERRVASENFERARQVVQTGNYDYAISLLTMCCRIEPGNFLYRQALRRAQKEKYGNNLRGSRFAFLSVPRFKARVKAAKATRDYRKVLEHGEAVLARNPWDAGTQMDMAEAFDALGLTDLAVFTLDQARQKYPKDPTLNRALARLFEKRGDFQKAIVLWQIVKEAAPHDVEAAHKAKDLAASETIARGKYQETADGSQESPVIGKMEASGTVKQDKLTRDAGPLLKRIEADPTEASLYVQLAGVYRRHNQDDRARAVLQQGMGPTGNHFSLQLELQELEVAPFRKSLEATEAQLKKLKERIAAGDEPTGDEPGEDDLRAARTRLIREISNREIEILRMKADRFPNDVGHRLELGIRLLKADRPEDAIPELQAAKRDEKHKGRAAMYLGACFRKRNNWRLAQRNFEEALAVLPATDQAGRKEVLYQLATGSAENGELARALDLGHDLANLDFAYKNIGNLLDDWQTKLQKA
ncbi:tetratricopeptide repeat protein [Fimbriiglobus ruber]|uniref:TPR repeat-containing protein n=1 Tax=Fimbriiglobus ruber TaxID=1908690 RepID=A0A225DP24_9BACT|nr:tetratricopeptide repeat protein [Fimbriiglobus ruber]OWK38105.1 TPR repeat-containing protein [Fimbriiglobus ruber]